MKKTLFILLSLAAIHLHAQDVIVKKDGSTILAKVLEVDETNIKYKKHSNQDGPTYTISIGNVMAINYKNGEKDTFDGNTGTPSVAEDIGAPKLVESPVSPENDQLLALYNQENSIIEKKYRKKADGFNSTFTHLTKSSVLRNSDVEIRFKNNDMCLYNLTDDNIYIDLANCFEVDQEGKFESYYDNKIVTTSKTTGTGSNKGIGLGLGSVANVLGIGGALGTLANGVNVGGGSNKTTSTTTTTTEYKERVITIPPKGEYHFGKYYAQIRYNDKLEKPLTPGEVRVYTEENSPRKDNVIITYSKYPNFNLYSTIKLTLFLYKEIGRSYNSFFRTYTITNINEQTIYTD